MQLKTWNIIKKDVDNKPLLERLIESRGLKQGQQIEDFLNPLSVKLIHPNAFSDMKKAVERLEKAIKDSEKILIYGDFDADGLTSTSLMLKTLKELNANVSYYIPTRETDGHGLNNNALVTLMVKEKPKVLITVDCGISNVEEVKFLNSFKIDVILTDHHEAPEELPNAYAIINPKAPNALDEKLETYQIEYLSSLAGVGVAFKLAQGLLEKFDRLDFSYDILPYVAVGTIADIVPLIGENRYYVLKGLDLISQGKHYGLKRLLDNAGYSNIDDGITAEQVAFGIAPRINASGRLDAVGDAIKVLTSDNKQEIEMSVIALENFNKIRQELCHNTFLEADSMVGNMVRENVIVLYKEDWHIGIIGIVASKLVEKYHKPTFMMTFSKDTNQVRCSARGVEGVTGLNIYDILSNISESLDGFGGHRLAGGMSFSLEKVSFEEIKAGLKKTVDEILNGEKIVPEIPIDLALSVDDLTLEDIQSLDRLEPYGASNPKPLFAIEGFVLGEKKLMGSNKEHLRLTVQKDGQTFNAIWWSKGDISLSKGDMLDIAFSPQLNTFNGNTTVQLIIKDVHSDALVYKEESVGIKIYDHRKKSQIYKQVDEYLSTSKLNNVVFAEDKEVISLLKTSPNIASRVKNRRQIEKCDSVMFFDYPPNEEVFEGIMKTAEPSLVHFMNYATKNDFEEFLKTLSGMVRFVSNNKNGVFSLSDSAIFLGKTQDLIAMSLDMFEQAGMFKVRVREEENYVLDSYESTSTSFSKTELYAHVLEEYNSIAAYKSSFKDVDLDELLKI